MALLYDLLSCLLAITEHNHTKIKTRLYRLGDFYFFQ